MHYINPLDPSIPLADRLRRAEPRRVAIHSAEFVETLQHRNELHAQRFEMANDALMTIAAAPSFRSAEWRSDKAKDALADIAEFDAKIERGEV